MQDLAYAVTVQGQHTGTPLCSSATLGGLHHQRVGQWHVGSSRSRHEDGAHTCPTAGVQGGEATLPGAEMC